MEIYNDDCFNIFPKIEDKSINLFLLDLPYANKKFGNCTACAWDTPIDLEKMWVEIKRTMKPNGIIVFFCNTKFGYALINSNPKWFKYDLIWEKSRKVGFLSANKMPLRKHENIYIFDNKEDDIEIVRNLELRKYAEKVKNYIGKTLKKINKELGHRKAEHFFYIKSSQFVIPTQEIYDQLSKLYDLEKMEGFLKFDDMKELEQKAPATTYNPQKTEGKPYKTNGRDNIGCYGKDYHGDPIDNKGDRHPTSILPEFKETHENIYIFKKEQGTYNPQKTEGKPYTATRQNADIYSETIDNIPTINKGDRHPTSILPEFEETHENIYIFKDKGGTYNPQKTEGHKPYIDKRNQPNAKGYYREDGTLYAPKPQNNEGKQHPTSILPEFETTILKFNNPNKTIHRTQKPVDLLEWLIKTYTNEDDLVMDFCMGSGSCGVACMNTKRKFIGVERDSDIFKLAEKRIEEHTVI
tara:strand:- start:172 stop:1572 length:1401 start_codon:yes stop_codon:yes gene_type:complete